MSDAAAHIAREAKALQVGLKELLKTHDVLDKEIEIQRKNLRRQYLRLLLVHPYAKESRDAETHLWMQTSYALISIYKQRIASLDRAIQNPPRQPQQNAQPQRVVEYRKLLQRFRQFLAEEERFWTQLILRFRRNFGVDAAQPALTALGILPETDEPPTGADGATSPRRNHYQFPPESDSPESTPLATTASQRESRLAILSKALVCLGDIARYKEQYNESGGRPRAGHEDGPPAVAAGKSSRGRRGGAPPAAPMTLPRMRNYQRAQQCYELARSLVPHDGNPSHQLAILASYQKDMFNSLAHYYRALCVRQPYDTASENMGTVLSRAWDQWKTRRAKHEEEEGQGGPLPPRLRVEAFKEKIIVLHAQWRLGVFDEDGVADRIIRDFEILASERVLPNEMISKVIVLSHGALWKHRMVRQPSNGEKKSRSPSVESRIASHLLALHRVLLNIGSRELLEVPPEDMVGHDLAQRITATFRRTLPALRMAGKWVRANTRYLSQASGAAPEIARPKGRSKHPSHKEKTALANGLAVAIDDLEGFWNDYVKFANALVASFPSDRLPALVAPLEEDMEMVGFLPLRKYMMGEGKAAASPNGHPSKADEDGQSARPESAAGLHPNEEQLMRISDMLADAKAVAEDENTPVVFDKGSFELKAQPIVFNGETINESIRATATATLANLHASALQGEPVEQTSDTDDDGVTVATRTDDDPVGDAFRQVLDASEGDDDDYEDEIVWNLTPLRSPQEVPAQPKGFMTPQRLSPTSPLSPKSPPYSPHKEAPLSPLQGLELNKTPPHGAPTAPSMSAGITAAELLNNMTGPQRLPPLQSSFNHHVRMPSAPTAPLSFGPNGPVQSIWSDDNTHPYSGSTKISNSLLAGSPFHSSASQLPAQNNSFGYAQSVWSNPLSSQASSNAFLPSSPTTMYSSQPSAPSYNSHSVHNLPGGHSRLPSESAFLPRNQLYQSQTVNRRYDPLRSSLPIGDQVNIPSRGLNNLPPSVYPDTIYSSSPGTAYSPRDTRDQYGHSLQTRNLNVDRTFTAPFISSSSIWGNPG